jgi:hypothetical protein
MGHTVKDQLKRAFALVLKPMVRLLIAQGVTHADLCETAKEVYVEVALRHFEDKEKINRSRVAVLTGLTRKEVKNVIDRAIATDDGSKIHSRPERVLTGWYSDPKYTGPYGIPLELHYEHDDPEDPSIVSLVRTYSGDMAPKQVLDLLLTSGCVVEVDNRYKPVRRNYIPEPLSPIVIKRLGDIGYWVFSTLAKNMEKESKEEFGYFDRCVFADDGLTDNVIVDFDSYLKDRGQVLLEEIDNWFAVHTRENRPDKKIKETGVYMVHYVDDGTDRGTLKELLVERGVGE